MQKRVAFVLALALAFTAAAGAEALDPVNKNKSLFGVAIGGADPVAYFSEGRFVEGSRKFAADWNGASWRFASAENRQRFLAEPERYAPRYGGYCAYAVAHNYTAKIDPEAWSIVEDRLYLNYDKTVRARWSKKQGEFIEQADQNWPGLLSGE